MCALQADDSPELPCQQTFPTDIPSQQHLMEPITKNKHLGKQEQVMLSATGRHKLQHCAL
jgi:hypothetical protein